VFEQLNLAVISWIEALRFASKRRLWLPLLAFGVFQAVLLFVLASFAYPLFSWFLAPVLRLSYGAAATHYPTNLVVLPAFFSAANLVVGVFAWAWTIGASVSLFSLAYRRVALDLPYALRVARQSYRAVLITLAPLIVLVVLLDFALPQVLPKIGEGPALLIRAGRYGAVAAGVLLEALFIVAPFLVVLDGRRPLAALRRGVLYSLRNLAGLTALVAVPTVLHLPVSFFSRHWRDILERSSPEIIIVLIAFDIVLFVGTNYLLLGGVTRYVLARRG
jgi:hypothetical protein